MYTAIQLTEIARSYFPSGVSIQSPLYQSTDEVRRRKAVCRQAASRRERFREAIRALEELYPSHWVGEENHLLLDTSFAVRVSTERHDPSDREAVCVVGCVSVLAPIYMTYAAWGAAAAGASGIVYHRDEKNAEVWDRVHSTFERLLGVTYVGPEVGLTIVPDIETGQQQFGNVSLYDVLFTTHRW